MTLTKEEVQVFNKGENAAFKLIDSRMSAAYTTLGAHLDIALPLPGTGAGYTTNFNGFAEALNDNTTTNWNGKLNNAVRKFDYMLETPGIRGYAVAA